MQYVYGLIRLWLYNYITSKIYMHCVIAIGKIRFLCLRALTGLQAVEECGLPDVGPPNDSNRNGLQVLARHTVPGELCVLGCYMRRGSAAMHALAHTQRA